MSNASPSTWMPLAWGDYLKNTMHLSTEEHGAYFLLIAAYWANGGAIENDQKSLENITKISFKKLRKVLVFFENKNGLLYHARIEAELSLAVENIEKSKKRTAAATAARRGNKNNVTDDVTTNVTMNVTCNTSPSPISTGDKSPSEINNIGAQGAQEKIKLEKVSKPAQVSEKVWKDFTRHRKEKKAPLTETALNGIAREAEKAGWQLERALKECCERGWAGFKAEWVANKGTRHGDFEAQDYKKGTEGFNVI